MRPKIFGLENNRYYCYLNAVIQCIFSISELARYYEDARFMEVNIKNPVNKGLKFSRTLSEFAEEINTKNQTIARAS